MALAGCCSPSIGVTWAWVYTKQQRSSSSRVRWRCSLLAVCVDDRRIVLTKVPLHTAALRLLARWWSINHPDPHSLSQTLQAVNCCFGFFFCFFWGWVTLCNSILLNEACFYWWRTARCVLKKRPWLEKMVTGKQQWWKSMYTQYSNLSRMDSMSEDLQLNLSYDATSAL